MSEKTHRESKILGRIFVTIAQVIIMFIWYTYVVEVWGPRAAGKWREKGSKLYYENDKSVS